MRVCWQDTVCECFFIPAPPHPPLTLYSKCLLKKTLLCFRSSSSPPLRFRLKILQRFPAGKTHSGLPRRGKGSSAIHCHLKGWKSPLREYSSSCISLPPLPPRAGEAGGAEGRGKQARKLCGGGGVWRGVFLALGACKKCPREVVKGASREEVAGMGVPRRLPLPPLAFSLAFLPPSRCLRIYAS